MLYLARFDTSFPADIDPELRNDILQREKAYGQELQAGGKIVHLWRVVGPKLANLSILNVDSNEDLQDLLAALPMRAYMNIEITPIAQHPSAIQVAG